MKKKFIAVILIFSVFLALVSKSYGFVRDDFEDRDSGCKIRILDKTQIKWGELTEKSDEMLDKLKEYFPNLTDNVLRNETVIETQIKIMKYNENNYKVYIGDNPTNVTKYSNGVTEDMDPNAKSIFNISELKSIFGLNESVQEADLTDGYTWRVNIIAKVYKEDLDGSAAVKIKALYAGSDIDKVYDVDIDDTSWKEDNMNIIEGGVELLDFIKTAKKWIGTNPLGALAAAVAHLPRTFGDICQYWANIIQTLPDGNAGHFGVTYKYEEITTGDDKEYNKYTNVGGNNDETSTIKTINIKKDENGNGIDDFKKETPIPYVIVDFYTIGTGNVDYFDINFLTGNKSTKYEKDENGNRIEVERHSSNSIWMRFRDIVAALVKLGIYGTASILLVSLIWSGINIVRHTFDNPEAQADSKKVIEKLANAVFALIGTILVMAICIYANEGVLKFIGESDTYELPIRVNVDGVYSFSTTFAGYARYMSTTSDPDEGLQIIGSAFEYMVLAFANLFIAIIGIARVLCVWILSIVGPIMSVKYVFGKQNQMDLRIWVTAYAVAVLIQIPIALVGSVAIYIA